MMIINTTSHADAPVAATSARSSEQLSLEMNLGSLFSSSFSREVHISPVEVSPEGQDRLVRITGVNTGLHAHAAVRMHDFLAKGYFWAYCPKTKTRHSQRSKVAT